MTLNNLKLSNASITFLNHCFGHIWFYFPSNLFVSVLMYVSLIVSPLLCVNCSMLKNVFVEKKHSLSLHWWLQHTQQKATHIKAAAGVRKKEGRKEGQKEAWSDGWKDRHDGSMEAQRCQGPVVLLALQLCWLMRGFLQAPSLSTQKKAQERTKTTMRANEEASRVSIHNDAKPQHILPKESRQKTSERDWQIHL